MHIEATPLAILTITTLVGLLAYLLLAKAEGKEAGRIMYFVGLLWLVAYLAHVRF